MRRRGKELRERLVGFVLFVILSPVFLACAVAIKVEGLVRPDARGSVFFKERRISQGREFDLLKFRILSRSATATLGPGPTHIALLEREGQVTKVGRILKQWYLDELPQLLNIVRGDMLLIGTRPWPLDLYEEELARGITRKRDMPAGLIGPVQASKGMASADPLDLDLQYWHELQTAAGWRLFLIDLGIIFRSLRVQLEHRGL